MRVAVLGGGPGGLFFAVLLKRQDPRHAVTVFERNAPDATFGFGVVFPERSLGYLLEADPETHAAFLAASVRWDAIEYRHRGEVRVCRGHGFSGIARTTLLALLQARAAQLGVDLRFRHEVDDLSRLEGYDLVVAADGVHSAARAALAAAVRPEIHAGRSRYIWLGTRKVFGALTFIFEESPDGWFGIHAYPYSREMSTVIVETDEETWRRAGLDRTDPAALAPGESDLGGLTYCERLFARHLDGHRLLGNHSRWLQFRTVRLAAWHAGRVAFLGDAAHTAHFSVGSGTRMAMEDAIALARALGEHADLAAALCAYERERRPAVERIQRAAEPSRRWWEQFRHVGRLSAGELACHHLTRTRLLTYGTLRVRDPGFVAAVEREFLGRHGVTGSAPCDAPFRLRSVRLANRVVRRAGWRSAEVAAARASGAGLVLVGPIPGHGDPWRVGAPSLSGLRGFAEGEVPVGMELPAVLAGDRGSLADVREFARQAAGAGAALLLVPRLLAGVEVAGVLEALRQAWPTDRPLAVEVEAWEDPDDADAVSAGLRRLQALGRLGADLVAVAGPRGPVRDPERALATQHAASELIRHRAGLPTLLLGGDRTVGDLQALLLSGRADLCEWPRLAWGGWRPGRARHAEGA